MAVKLLFFLLASASAYELQSVLIFSRHNIRTPLTDELQQYTPNKVPTWSEKPSFLTAKGAMMEEFMGSYFKEWFKEHKFISDTCPDENTVRIHANNRQRTIETAKSFAKTLFEDCDHDVPIQHKTGDEEDPIFSLLFTNTTAEFKEEYLTEASLKLSQINLTEAYAELNRILRLNKSEVCLEKSLCDLTIIKDIGVYEIGKEPRVDGPLGIGNSIVDMFLMQYYDGAPLDEIGWGKIDLKTFETLMRISRQSLNVRFNITIVSKYILRNFLDYATDIFVYGGPKLIAFFGHDSNIVPLMKAFSFKPFALPEHLEAIPLGGKIVFQTWKDIVTSKKFMKVNYVYPAMKQLREGEKFSFKNPPIWVNLEFKNCDTDQQGYCPYDDFIQNVIRKL